MKPDHPILQQRHHLHHYSRMLILTVCVCVAGGGVTFWSGPPFRHLKTLQTPASDHSVRLKEF